MSVAKQSSKTHNERLMGIEEQMLYLVEVPDSIQFLEQQLKDIAKNVDGIEAMFGRLDRLPIQELLTRVDTLESRVMRTENVTYEHGDSSSGSVAQMEEQVMELDNSQKNVLEMTNGMTEDF